MLSLRLNALHRSRTEMDSKVLLITGGAKRIGAEIAKKFHDEGFNVILSFQSSSAEATEVASKLNKLRKNSAVARKINLAELETIDLFFRECQETFGPLTCLINNASVFAPTDLKNISATEIKRTFDINLIAPILLSKNMAFQKEKSSIINILDIFAVKPLTDYFSYTISKAGLRMATKALAKELGPNIRVNGVSPGIIIWPEDDINKEFMSADIVRRLTAEKKGRALRHRKCMLFLSRSRALHHWGNSHRGWRTKSQLVLLRLLNTYVRSVTLTRKMNLIDKFI